MWDKGTLSDLGTLGGSSGTANGINDAGEVVGTSDLPGDQTYHAFVWKNGVMTDLGTVNGDDCSIAFHINSKGQIVGTSFPCAGGPIHGFLWQHGIMTDYNVFAPPGSSLTPWGDGAFINDRGEIAGFNTFNNHAFLLVPCGEGTAGCVDAVEGFAATSNIPARSAGTLTTSSIQRPRMLAAWRARLAQRYRIPGLGAPRN